MDATRPGDSSFPPPPLSIQTRRAAGASCVLEEEPLSPTSRSLKDIYIVAVAGLGKPINYDAVRAGLDTTLAQHHRFRSIRAMDNKGRLRWVRTTVNVDEHIVVPDLDAAAVSANPDKVLEDYMASLSTLPPMDDSRPLWEVHLLNFPTSEAASAVALRAHHALGDGASLISLFLACTRSLANPGALPVMPSSSLPKRERRTAGRIYAMPPPPRSSSAGALLAFAASVLWYYVVLAWHTAVDIARFVDVVLLAGGDPRTVFTGVKGVESRSKRFVSRSLGFGDVKHVKNTLGCTVNDVLFGVTSAALSRYYFRKLGDRGTKKGICLKSLLVVNMRPTPGIHALENMMNSNSSKKNDVRWGNQLGYIMVPFHIAMHDDPLEYVRQAKKTLDRKKYSLEALFTHTITEMVSKISKAVSGALFHRMVSRTTVIFSNVMGPAESVELYGHPVIYAAPSVYGLASALTIHWQSYADTIRVVLAVDDVQFPDCHLLLDDFAESLKMIRYAT